MFPCLVFKVSDPAILMQRCVRDFRTLLAEVITPEMASQMTENGKTALTSWSEAKQRLKPDPRYTKMPRKDRESLWSRHAEDILRKQKTATSDQKKPDAAEGRSRKTADYSQRWHGRR